MKNRLHYTFGLILLITCGLLFLGYLPAINIGDMNLRKVDLLSDVRMTENTEVDSLLYADSIADTIDIPKPAFVDSCKTGMECIEDFSDSTMRGMSRFYEALAGINSSRRPVRIAYFGDSFIEGDILTSDLRYLLQKEFGGSGVGYVTITSQFPGFRPTVKHGFEGWKSHNVTDTIGFDHKKQGLSNSYYLATEGAYVSLSGMKKYLPNHESCSVSSLFYLTSDSLHIKAIVNGGTENKFHLKGNGALQMVSVKGDIHDVKWTVGKGAEKAVFYAATMDADRGVILDNFSTRGSSGQQLSGIPFNVLRGYEKLREYDLVILQYGLNVAFEGGKDYTYYKKGMKPVVENMKKAFPESSVLIVGIGDRETKDKNGNLRTMPGLKNLIISQKALAGETGVAFWNLYNAMGGEGSMQDMVNSKPAMANYDYTHINFHGGRHIANLLFEAMMYGKEQYEKRKAYEEE